MYDTPIKFTQMICGKCGCVFAIPEFMRAEKEEIGGNWYCPNGHSRIYGETNFEKAEKRLVAQKKDNDLLCEQLGELKSELRKAKQEICTSKKPKKK